MSKRFSRRSFVFGSAGAATAAVLARLSSTVGGQEFAPSTAMRHQSSHSDAVAGTVGSVDHVRNGFHPADILKDFNYGDRILKENGQTVREYEIVAYDREIELVPGLFYPAWTYNGRIPGPTLRCTAGDRLRVHFTNGGSHPHTIHFHGIHRAAMDGVPLS